MMLKIRLYNLKNIKIITTNIFYSFFFGIRTKIRSDNLRIINIPDMVYFHSTRHHTGSHVT